MLIYSYECPLAQAKPTQVHMHISPSTSLTNNFYTRETSSAQTKTWARPTITNLSS